ncbi:calcium-dependent cysteine-type endopeptidase [Malassezia pachydermatis]
MAHDTYAQRLGQARALASNAVSLELAKHYEDALDIYIRATDLLLQLAQCEGVEASSSRTMAVKLLSRAEKLKPLCSYSSRNSISDASLSEKEFQDPSIFQQDSTSIPSLSPQQIQHQGSYSCTDDIPLYLPRSIRGGNLQQGYISDCSFVSALEVAAEHDARWGTHISTQALYPQTPDGLPTKSANGKYIVKLHNSGQIRQIVMDAYLPRDPKGSLLTAKPYGCPQLWPGLLEKAYLMAHQSGYEFQGSDASIDLYMLTGWIPEHIPMHERGFQREKTWARVWDAWQKGHCMLTLGTGAHCSHQDLESLHCYGILKLDEADGARCVSIVNPWKLHDASSEQSSGRISMSWENVCLAFDTLFINWDPSIFPHRTVLQGAWDVSDSAVRLDAGNAVQTDQYHVTIQAPGSTRVWFHLERHIYECNDKSYIAVHAFPAQEQQRRANVDHGGLMGVYVNVAHTLLCLDDPCSSQYTLAISRHGSAKRSPYTLRVYSDKPVDVQTLPRTLPHRSIVKGSWRGRSIGGPPSSPHFRHNPQFRVTVHEGALLPRIISMITTISTLSVQATLAKGGERVLSLDDASIIASSGAYSRGIALCDALALQPGVYTLVVSSQEMVATDFSLVLEGNVRTEIVPLPEEGAGQYRRSDVRSLPCTWVLTLPRAMKVLVCASQAPTPLSTAPLSISLLDGDRCLTEQSVPGSVACAILRTEELSAGTYTVRIGGPMHWPVYLDVYGMQPVHLSTV